MKSVLSGQNHARKTRDFLISICGMADFIYHTIASEQILKPFQEQCFPGCSDPSDLVRLPTSDLVCLQIVMEAKPLQDLQRQWHWKTKGRGII